MKKYLFSFLCFILFSMLLVNENLLAGNDTVVSGLTCYDTKKPASLSERQAFLTKLGLEETKKMNLVAHVGNETFKANNVTVTIDYDVLYSRHIVVYNTAADQMKTWNKQKYDGRDICGLTGKRYIGFNTLGVAVVDPISYPDFTPDKSYLVTRSFIKYPWTKNYLASGTKPNPSAIHKTIANASTHLSRAVDAFSNGVGDSSVGKYNYTHTKEYSLKEANGDFLNKNNVLGTSLMSVLTDYAVIAAEPTKNSPGIFYLYTSVSTKDGILYRYSSNFMAQYEDPFNSTFDASVTIDGNSHYKADDFNPTFTFKLESDNAQHKLNASCIDPSSVATKDKNQLYCRTPMDPTRVHAGLRLQHKDSGETLIELRYPIDTSLLKFDLKAGNTIKLSYKDIIEKSGKTPLPFDETDDYILKVWMTYYQDSDGLRETDYSNNDQTKTFTVEGKPNASVVADMTPIFPAGAELDSSFLIKNTFDLSKQGTLKYYIHKQGYPNDIIPLGESGKTEDTMAFNVGAKGNATLKIPTGIKLDPGDYVLKVSITEFPDERTYEDNYDDFEFSVDMFIPENTICDFVNPSYVETTNRRNLEKVLDVTLEENKDKAGISRTCIGYTPNYPSTVVEDGQKTFFYIAYKALAFPIPAYHVQNLDPYGIKQELTMNEPYDAMGSCEPKKGEVFDFLYKQTIKEPYVALDNCTQMDTFYYFPSKFNDSIKTASTNPQMALSKDWLGPYELGAYDYYHYGYRGRLVPKMVDLEVKILDPEENPIYVKNQLGIASMKFFFNKECYNLGTATNERILDITSQCRLIQLYVPGNTDTFKKNSSYFQLPQDSKPFSIPEEKDRVDFLNVGLHSLELFIKEEHVYLYQKDEGSEIQGKEKFARTGGYGPIDTTKIVTTPEGYYEQIPQIVYDDPSDAVKKNKYTPFMNHCYSFENATSQFGSWNNDKFTYNPTNPRINCIHDSNSDFYYWMFNWSEVRTLDSFHLFEFTFTPSTPSANGYKKITP